MRERSQGPDWRARYPIARDARKTAEMHGWKLMPEHCEKLRQTATLAREVHKCRVVEAVALNY